LVTLLAITCLCNTAKASSEEESVQFFIRLNEEGICNNPEEVAVFALDSYGLINSNYEGLKEVHIRAKEIGGKEINSFSPLPDQLEFQKGRASFFIQDSEPETLELTIREGDNISPFPARVSFKERVFPQRFQIELADRGYLDQPQQATVWVLDKAGNAATDYIQKGLRLEVEELGRRDKSYTLEPESLDIYEGKSTFSLANTEQGEELILRLRDPRGQLQPAETRIIFSAPDREPPQMIDLKMETLAFVEITFNEELDSGSATDPYNYEVVCLQRQHPRSVEFHGNRVILELENLLRPYNVMYVEVRNLKDIAGNEIERDTRSPDYSVPYVPINLDIDVSQNPSGLNTPVTLTVTARCISGRVPQFINAQFEIEVSEGLSDNSFTLSSPYIQMVGGRGEFTISNSAPEKLTITIDDPQGEVSSASIELEFI
jgi:hypothetical protein